MPSQPSNTDDTQRTPVVQLKLPRRNAHPWIFQRALIAPTPRPPSGALAELINPDGSFAGRGFYNGHARVGFRVLEERADVAIDRAWFAERLARALSLRRDVLGLDAVTNAYRLVHAEGDGLGGLVVDRFGDLLVVEWFAAGMWRQRATLFELLRELFPHVPTYASADRHVQKQESFDAGMVPVPEAVTVHEHGVRYLVQAGSGHKTGFFADQRDNRARLAALCAGRSVLDLCCNSGGFALNAAVRGGARKVIGIDRDPAVIAQAMSNATLNGVVIEFIEADLFAWLDGARERGESFDVVVLDPSKQTRDATRIEQALAAYYRMNLAAMSVVAKGGVLLTCSCTGLIATDVFLETLRRAAWAARRTLQIFDVQGAAPDHPVLAQVPESRYLKAVFCRVW
ncbi:MAG: class I SAM-dependent rRNA methyltransferase [Lysobacterales bacterium]